MATAIAGYSTVMALICQADDHAWVEPTYVGPTMPQGQYKLLCIKVKTIHFNYAYK